MSAKCRVEHGRPICNTNMWNKCRREMCLNITTVWCKQFDAPREVKVFSLLAVEKLPTISGKSLGCTQSLSVWGRSNRPAWELQNCQIKILFPTGKILTEQTMVLMDSRVPAFFLGYCWQVNRCSATRWRMTWIYGNVFTQSNGNFLPAVIDSRGVW